MNAGGQLGGAERSLLDMMVSLRQARPSWVLELLTGADGPLLQRVRELGIATRVLPLPPPLARLGESGTGGLALIWHLLLTAGAAVGYTRLLRRAIASTSPSVVHSNSLKMHLLAARSMRSRTSRLIWHLHDYTSRRSASRRLLRWHASHCDLALANSESVALDARRVLGANPPVAVVPNAVDLERFSPCGDAADVDRLAGLPPAPAGVVRVGLIGTFGHWKGHKTFLKALTLVPPDIPIRAYVIGAPLYQTTNSQYTRAELESYRDRLALSGIVGFTGFVLQPEDAIRALDIVVHASTEPEPFGLVIIEAMACGRPVIVADAGGPREIITDGLDALTHAPGDAAGLAARIAQLARDPDARRRMGHAGRQTAEQRFDRARLRDQLLEAYEGLMEAA